MIATATLGDGHKKTSHGFPWLANNDFIRSVASIDATPC